MLLTKHCTNAFANVFFRRGIGAWAVVFCVLFAGSGSALLWGQEAEPLKQWQVIPEKSHLGFSVMLDGTATDGAFSHFTTAIVFDPDRLADSHVDVVVDLNYITAAYDDMVKNLKTAIWFDVGLFPTARFVGRAFTALGDDRYRVRGALTIRGVTRVENLDFTLTRYDEKQAVITGHLVIDRRDYGVGQGIWAKLDPVAGPVEIRIDLETRARDGDHRQEVRREGDGQ